MTPKYFRGPEAFRAWLEKNHAKKTVVLVGFWKTHTKKKTMTWPQSVDEALCFGWIDGHRKGIDDRRYTIRFTPRKKGSNWSKINLRRVPELIDAGRMHPAGMSAYQARSKSRTYAYEARPKKLDAAYERTFRKKARAWAFFSSQAPSYQRTAAFWVMSAKSEETRERRLAQLIAASAKLARPAPFIVRRR